LVKYKEIPTLLRFSGIFSEIFLITAILFLGFKEKDFRMDKEAFSYLGINKKTQKTFNIFLIIYSFIRLIFLTNVINELTLGKNFLIVFCTIGGPLLLILVSFVPWDQNKTIHNLFAYGMTIFSVVFIIFFGLFFLSKNLIFSLVSFIIVISMSLSTLYVFLKNKVTGYFQTFFFINCMIWDWLITFYLFKH